VKLKNYRATVDNVFLKFQAFDDCCNLESVIKLINIVGSVLERPLIKDEFNGKFKSVLDMLKAEINTSQV